MSARRGAHAANRLQIVGRDLAHTFLVAPSRSRLLPWILLGVLLSALGIAALRVDQIGLRYGLAKAMKEERALLEERRLLVARVQALRDPARLHRLAIRQGLVRPERVIELPAARAFGGQR